PKPPMMPDGVGAYLDVEDGIGYARSIVPQGEEHTWTLTVSSPTEEEVSLRIVDTSELPGDMAVWLTDQASGKRVDLRHAPSYSYTARDGQRRFEIELGERDDLLQVMGVSAQAAGDGAQISFTLSAAGSVTVDVLNIAGRTIRRIVTDRECDAGLQTLSWDGRSERGTKVPSGMYLIRVTAAAPTGEQCQGLTTLSVR
ncbi:MAG: FlgD immunoglobulin-like domain containing protein, partial [Armatimonadota bacterium]